MRKIEGLGLAMPAVVAGLLVVGMGLAVGFTVSRVAPLPELFAIPHATLAAPRAGPAIYAGRLYSVAPRVSPGGTKAALYWWWGVRHVSTNDTRTLCKGQAFDHLLLEADGKRVPMNVFEGLPANALALIADTRSESPEPYTMDLGPLPLITQDAIPDTECSARASTNKEYQERSIPEGTTVEVLGCYDRGALHSCPLPVGGVLAVHTLAVNLHRRVRAAHAPLRMATLLCAIPLLVLGVSASFMRKRRHTREARPEDDQ